MALQKTRVPARSRTARALLVFWLLIVPCACRRQEPGQRFDLRGSVLRIDKEAGMVTVQHDAIPGYMPAMTMDYAVKDKWVLDILKPGQMIEAKLAVTPDRAWLENVVVTQEANPGAGSPEAEEAELAALGRDIPNFALINQDRKRISLNEYRGKALLLTFIYTRCPLPNYCPLMSQHFAEIVKEAGADPKLAGKVHLLSISIDPENDTPAVLRSYGLEHVENAAEFQQWEFASGRPEQVRKVAEFFGLKYWTQGGQIQHSLVTALIGPAGKVEKIYRGNAWQPADVIRDVTAALQTD